MRQMKKLILTAVCVAIVLILCKVTGWTASAEPGDARPASTYGYIGRDGG